MGKYLYKANYSEGPCTIFIYYLQNLCNIFLNLQKIKQNKSTNKTKQGSDLQG